MSGQRRSGSRRALLLACLLFVVALVWVALTAGESIPAHFNNFGEVTRRESPVSFLASMGGVGLGMAALFGAARWLLPRVPAQAINLPGRDAHTYWTDPANRPQFDRMMSEDLEWIGAATLVLLAWMTALAGTAGDSVNVWLLAVPTALYVVAIIGFCVYIVRGRYRVPS